MIEFLYAHIAIITVGSSRWSKNITSITKFNLLRMSFHSASIKYRLVLANLSSNIIIADWDSSEIRMLEIAKYFGYNSWVDKS